MEIKELRHVVWYVTEVKSSAHFHGDVLGWKRIPEPFPGAAIFCSGRTYHELLILEVGSRRNLYLLATT